jgi:shikimate kinase
VGAALAHRLGWDFVDVDDAIVQQAGASVAELFRTHGEAAFREMEARLTAGLSSRDRVVLSPGGGWAARPGALEALPEGTAVVWLDVSPAEALRRLQGTAVERPLLAGPDPVAALTQLAEQRSERYGLAQLVLHVDGRSTPEIAQDIQEWLERSTS